MDIQDIKRLAADGSLIFETFIQAVILFSIYIFCQIEIHFPYLCLKTNESSYKFKILQFYKIIILY
jgi:hypothetical protein